MAAWVIRKGVEDPKQLKRYKVDGYSYNAELSKPAVPVFTRDKPPG